MTLDPPLDGRYSGQWAGRGTSVDDNDEGFCGFEVSSTNMCSSRKTMTVPKASMASAT